MRPLNEKNDQKILKFEFEKRTSINLKIFNFKS